MALTAGTQLGPYVILTQIGAGGMGEVYRARDTRLDRIVAIKVSKTEFSERFEREAKAIAALNHPHVCQLHDVGPNYLVMEFVDGAPIAPVGDFAKVVDIALQIAEGMTAAHAKGIVHRDLKPANILLTHDGQVKILDFGLALIASASHPDQDGSEQTTLLTGAGITIGTIAYMSPEQARGQQLDARTDLWSFGVVLYEMVAGSRPFQGKTTAVVFEALLTKPPVPLRERNPEVPEKLERIVGKLLEKDRDRRYASADELRNDLKEFQRQVDSGKSTPQTRSSSALKLAIAAAVILVVAAGGILFRRIQPPAQPVPPVVKQIAAPAAAADLSPSIASAAPDAKPANSPPETLLTNKDVLVLADLTNSTGDPVFDGSLRQELLFQIEQSSFLKIMDDEQVRQSLKFLERPPGEQITDSVARDVCRREGEKATMGGSIALVGQTYLFTLQATNCQTGQTLAREQVQAQDKGQVLQAVAKAATGMRVKLGESLKSVQKLDRAYAEGTQVTTSSLEALQAFSLATAEAAKTNYAQAASLDKRATELDPNFAMAFAIAGINYGNAGQTALRDEYIKKAFALIDHTTTQRERFFIEGFYNDTITGDLIKTAETYALATHIYPRDSQIHGQLGAAYRRLGQLEKALEEYQQAVKLSPRFGNLLKNLVNTYLQLNRFDEAKTVMDIQLAQNFITPAAYHEEILLNAYRLADHAAQEKEIQWFAGRQEEPSILLDQLQNALFMGQDAKAKEFSRKLPSPAPPELVAQFASNRMCAPGATDLGLLPGTLCVNVDTKLREEILKQRPNDTLIKNLQLPLGYAVQQLNDGQPDKAIDLLRSAIPYERVNANVVYVRGLAYLRSNRGAEAAREFQKTLDQKLYWGSTRYLDAYFGVARGWALAGDTPRAKRTYQAFLDFYKDADQDNRYLTAAKKELAALR